MAYQRYHLMTPPGQEEEDQDAPYTFHGPIPVPAEIQEWNFLSRTLQHKSVRRPFPAQQFKSPYPYTGRDVKHFPSQQRQHQPPKPPIQPRKHDPIDPLPSPTVPGLLWWTIKEWGKQLLPKNRIRRRMDTFVGHPKPLKKKTDSHFLLDQR